MDERKGFWNLENGTFEQKNQTEMWVNHKGIPAQGQRKDGGKYSFCFVAFYDTSLIIILFNVCLIRRRSFKGD